MRVTNIHRKYVYLTKHDKDIVEKQKDNIFQMRW